jgi:hypothetical protein
MVGDIETHPYLMGTDGGKAHLAYTAGYMVELSSKETGTTGTYHGEDKSYYKSLYLQTDAHPSLCSNITFSP